MNQKRTNEYICNAVGIIHDVVDMDTQSLKTCISSHFLTFATTEGKGATLEEHKEMVCDVMAKCQKDLFEKLETLDECEQL